MKSKATILLLCLGGVLIAGALTIGHPPRKGALEGAWIGWGSDDGLYRLVLHKDDGLFALQRGHRRPIVYRIEGWSIDEWDVHFSGVIALDIPEPMPMDMRAQAAGAQITLWVSWPTTGASRQLFLIREESLEARIRALQEAMSKLE